MLKIRKNDLVIFAVILFAALSAFAYQNLTSKNGNNAIIKVDNEIVASFTLNEEIEYRIEGLGGYNVVEISNGKVSVIESDCKNQVCVNTHYASKAGDVIVCLPHKVVVVIE